MYKTFHTERVIRWNTILKEYSPELTHMYLKIQSSIYKIDEI